MKKINKKDNELSQLISRYLPYWPYFLISLISCGILAEIYLHFKTPVYQVSASMLLKNGNKNNSDNNSFLSSMEVFSSQKIVENETGILKSHTIMDEVVKKLELYAPVFKEGLVRDQSAYILSPVLIQFRDPDNIKIPKKSKKIDIKFDGTKAVINGENYFLNKWENSPWGEMRIVPNPNYKILFPDGTGLSLLARIKNKINSFLNSDSKNDSYYFRLNSVSSVAYSLISNLGVEAPDKLSTIVNLSLKDQVPERGEDILNTLLQYYNAASLDDKNKLAGNMVSFLDKRLKYVTGGLDSISLALQLYKANKGGVDLSEQSKLILGSVTENDKKINEINVRLSTLRQIRDYVNGSGGAPGIISTEDNENDAVLSQYLNNLYDARLQYDKLKRTTAENNPLTISLKEQIDKIKPTLLQYTENKINTLETARDNLSATSGQYSSALRTIPQKQRELLEISRQKAIKDDLYNFLSKKREEAALSYAATVPDTRIIDQAVVSPFPVSPKKTVVLGFMLILGMGIPVIFIKLREKVLTKDDVRDILDYPFLGEISYLSDKETSIVVDKNRNFITEQFRKIRTSLNPVLNTDSARNKFMITSSISGEGKSFIASNLSVSLALSGKKVVLIDLDLHKPTLNAVLNVDANLGVNEYLSGETKLESIIHQTEISPNLYLIPAGTVIEDSQELLLNGKLDELFAFLDKQKYDYIFIETAPINIISDAYVISSFFDATLLATRYKYTSKQDLMMLKENILIGELKNPGTILNGVKNKGGYGRRYYGYVERNA